MTKNDSLPDAHLVSRRCPCCNSDSTKPEVASIPPGESLGWLKLRDSWIGFFKPKVFLTYVRCLGCGLLYAPLYFTNEALRELYGNMPDNSAGLTRATLERTQRGYFDFLRRHSNLSGDYIELGPDIGLFTQYVASSGGAGYLWLYEPNLSVHRELGRRAKGRDFQIRSEMADFSAIPDGGAGICVLIHVLDHLPDPKSLLQQLRRKLAPDSRVLIVTHDERSPLARAFGARWPAYCLQHPQLFNRASTERFLIECGLVVVETRKSINHFPATYLLKHLLFAVGLHSLSRKIDGDLFVLPSRLGNIMTIARPG